MSLAEEQIEMLAIPAAPTDPVFDAWARGSFVWLPEKGMGRLKVMSAPYDEDYFQKYVGYANTEMGKKITEERVALVNRYTKLEVVDVGIGCGSFVEARQPWTWGFDVNPAGVAWLHEGSYFKDPYAGPMEAVSLWDVLEHIPEPQQLLRNVTKFVFVSLPIVPGDGPPSPEWKHFRRDEHCWYWTRVGFQAWMFEHGFQMEQYNEMEMTLGREDIGTFVFRRVK